MASEDKTVTKIHSSYVHQYDAYMERRKRKKQRLIRRLVLFAVVAVLAIGSLTFYHLNQRAVYAEKQKEYEQLEKELAKLKKEEEQLEEEIELLNDEEYVLDIARTNYFFSKDGEMIFKLPDEKPSY